jgi:hypothetical protein
MVAIVGCRPVCEEIEPVSLPGNDMPAPPGPSGSGNNIPDFDPSQSYDFPEVVVHNGVIYRALGPIAPGPFDPADWEALDNSGGGATVVTEDTATATIGGDGSAGDPLTVDVNVQALTKWGAGQLIHVDAIRGVDALTQDASIFMPYQTVGFALAQAETSDVILLAPGTYVENVAFVSDVVVQGFGPNDANPVIIRGHHTIGDGIARVRLKDLQLVGTAGAPALVVANSAGSHTLDNVSISHADGPTATAVQFTGNNQSFMTLNDGSIAGVLSLQDPLQVSAFALILRGGSEPTTVLFNSAPVQLSIIDHIRLGKITHGAGLLLIDSIGYIIQNGGVSLVSTASAANGALFMKNVTTIQPNGSYGAIQKTGTAPYMMLGVKSDPLAADFAGLNLLGDNAKHVHAQYQPVNYFPLSASVRDHLKAIDEALPFSADGRTVVHEIVVSRPGPVLEDQIILDYVASKPITLKASLPDIQYKFRGTAGQSVTLNLFRNDVAIGDITIDTTSININFAVDVEFLVGDVFTVSALEDAAFSNVALTLQGLRQLDFVA